MELVTSRFYILFAVVFLLITALAFSTIQSSPAENPSCFCPTDSLTKKECPPPPNCNKPSDLKRTKREGGEITNQKKREQGEEEEEKEKPYCEYLSQVERGTWVNRSWFEPETCRLKNLSTEEALSCFAGKTVSFIGDSTMGGIVRNIPAIFGKMHEYSSTFDRDALRREGKTEQELRLLIPSSFFHEEKKIVFRKYNMWKAEMWDKTGYGGAPDNANSTIQDVLTNSSNHLVFINIAAHHQNRELEKGLIGYLSFILDVARFHHERIEEKKFIAPFIWVSMNAQNAASKPGDRKYQDVRLSLTYNELAHWSFERQAPTIPMMDFHGMIKEGFPYTTGDGIHSTVEVNVMKWKIILHYICGKGGWNLDFKLNEPIELDE